MKTQKKAALYTEGINTSRDLALQDLRRSVVIDVSRRIMQKQGYDAFLVRTVNNLHPEEQHRQESPWINTVEKERLAEKYMEKLNVLYPSTQPRMTDHIVHAIEYIQSLINNNQATVVGDDVLYNNMKIWEGKQFYEKFVTWRSPWGVGVPTDNLMHTVISHQYFPNMNITIDNSVQLIDDQKINKIISISDVFSYMNIYSYKKNEGFIIDNHKLVNDSEFSMKDFFDNIPHQIIRYLLLNEKPHNDITIDEETLFQAQYNYENIEEFFRQSLNTFGDDFTNIKDVDITDFYTSIENDLDTHSALLHIQERISSMHYRDNEENLSQAKTIFAMLDILGFNLLSKQWDIDIKETVMFEKFSTWVEEKISQRNHARLNKDWENADSIRDELHDKGVVLIDHPQKTTWKYA